MVNEAIILLGVGLFPLDFVVVKLRKRFRVVS